MKNVFKICAVVLFGSMGAGCQAPLAVSPKPVYDRPNLPDKPEPITNRIEVRLKNGTHIHCAAIAGREIKRLAITMIDNAEWTVVKNGNNLEFTAKSSETTFAGWKSGAQPFQVFLQDHITTAEIGSPIYLQAKYAMDVCLGWDKAFRTHNTQHMKIFGRATVQYIIKLDELDSDKEQIRKVEDHVRVVQDFAKMLPEFRP